jgi:NADPH-dependent F420 reductase
VTIRIGLLGGTGIEGRGLALRFASAGAKVVLGSRFEDRAREAATRYNALLGRVAILGAENRQMLAQSEIILLTVPFDQAPNALLSYGADFAADSILVDVTVPMRFRDGRAEYLERPEGSNSEALAPLVPDRVHLVGAFKTVPAHALEHLETPLDCDVFVCGDDAGARSRVMEAARLLPSVRPLDAGPLAAARVLERMTVLAVNLNRRYKKNGARFRVLGL